MYCLPIKYGIRAWWRRITRLNMRMAGAISQRAPAEFLDKPENQRVWCLHATESKLRTENTNSLQLPETKKDGFQECYGRLMELNWILFSTIRIALSNERLAAWMLFSTYSRKLSAGAFPETENHADHFRALKMAYKLLEVKPYIIHIRSAIRA